MAYMYVYIYIHYMNTHPEQVVALSSMFWILPSLMNSWIRFFSITALHMIPSTNCSWVGAGPNCPMQLQHSRPTAAWF